VNGRVISSVAQLHHGDRLLWGNNHFFRINIPRAKKKSPPGTSSPIKDDAEIGQKTSEPQKGPKIRS